MAAEGPGSLKVVLLDRDGVLNADREDYVKTPEEFRILPGAAEAVARLNRAGYSVAVVSNQAGVPKGLLSEDALWEITSLLRQEVEKAGGEIDGVYYCLHRNEDRCGCRKPQPGLILRACADFGVSPTECVLVGDAERDVKAARAAGCRSVLVLTGHASAEDIERFQSKPDFVADDLSGAVDWILVEDAKTYA